MADTIAAQASAPGRGGVGIIRISGNHSRQVAQAILNKIPEIRVASYLPFYDDNKTIIDQGIAIFYAAPHSFTGEDVLELQGHGGSVVMDMLLKEITKLGVRLARPGEFSERAFLNDKLDLAQAEAIADLIDASSEQAARSALRSLQGEFSQSVNQLVDDLIHLRIFVEAGIDFPEEEIDFLSDGKVEDKLSLIINNLNQLQAQAKQGSLLREGMNIVIAGKPNVGKSSLLNRLSGKDSAIVTEIEGTTRDVLREQILLDGLPVHIIDTAGLRESDDPVEKIGIARAWDEIEKADQLLLVIDGENEKSRDIDYLWKQLSSHTLPSIPVTLIINKIDLTKEIAVFEPADLTTQIKTATIKISAKHNQGIDLLTNHLKQIIGYQQTNEGGFMARRRHLAALERADLALERGKYQLQSFKAGELLAEELRLAQNALSEITGEFTSDDLLGEIFSSFCIGK